jgi:hypothetical protein
MHRKGSLTHMHSQIHTYIHVHVYKCSLLLTWTACGTCLHTGYRVAARHVHTRDLHRLQLQVHTGCRLASGSIWQEAGTDRHARTCMRKNGWCHRFGFKEQPCLHLVRMPTHMSVSWPRVPVFTLYASASQQQTQWRPHHANGNAPTPQWVTFYRRIALST